MERPHRAPREHPALHPLHLGGRDAALLLAGYDRPRPARDQRLLRRGLLGDSWHSLRPLRHDEHLEDPRRRPLRLGRGGARGQPGGDLRRQDAQVGLHGRGGDARDVLPPQPRKRRHALPPQGLRRRPTPECHEETARPAVRRRRLPVRPRSGGGDLVGRRRHLRHLVGGPSAAPRNRPRAGHEGSLRVHVRRHRRGRAAPRGLRARERAGVRRQGRV